MLARDLSDATERAKSPSSRDCTLFPEPQDGYILRRAVSSVATGRKTQWSISHAALLMP
jgi:hypothetical protein